MAPSGSSITVGGKDSTLSPAAVYAVSCGICKVQIDSSAVEKLSQTRNFTLLRPEPNPSTSKTLTLTLEEARAALLVLLNKLIRNKLLSNSFIRPALPLLVEKTLALSSIHETLDFSSPVGLLTSLSVLSGKTLDEVGVTGDEISLLEGSYPVSIGLCATLDCCSSALMRVSDAVAALSCEAARADITVFDLPDSRSNKDEVDTARDMKDLLLGSKLASQVSSESFAGIPVTHGGFKEVVRALHTRVRIELNSTVKVKKTDAAGSSGIEDDLVRLVMQLALSILSMSKLSLGRARSMIASVADQDLRSKVVESFEKGCPSYDSLRDVRQSIFGKVSSGSDNFLILRSLYEFLVQFREIVAWEAALALFVLETDDSIEKIQAGTEVVPDANGSDPKAEKKSGKKKKKTLGKGTSVIRRLLRDQLASRNVSFVDDVAVLVEWAQELKLFFDPQDVALDTLLGKLKEILESNDVRRLPKIPKGTRDFGKEQMAIRERAFSIILRVFKMHGATALDTPVFELRETLMGKYGEDSKLVYDLADQGGELCSLRYDLTVPFARYLAMNSLSSLKRYQIAKVYRRDNPSKGRYREFYQCDFDIAGQYETMDPDFEVIKVLTQLLDRLEIGSYEIKLNHRKLLDGMLEICGISSDKFRTVCSSIDKLDKQSFEQIKKELVEEKGLAVEMAEKIGTFVEIRGAPLEILSKLKKEGSQFLENNSSAIALGELEILFKALEKSKCLDKVVFDLSLARGLDYYTGVIFEAVFKGATQVGSIAAGGRYDNLVGMFSGKQVPAVGVSLGIERVFTIMEQLEKERKDEAIRATETQVLVAVLSKDVCLAAELVGELWDADISAEYGLNKRTDKHIDRAAQCRIPWMVIVGGNELTQGVITLKDVVKKKDEVVPREKMVEELRKRLNIS